MLHGGKTQDVREVSIKGFRDNTFNILIATDVAGRGIDVPDVTLVVNYDMPGGIVSAVGSARGEVSDYNVGVTRLCRSYCFVGAPV